MSHWNPVSSYAQASGRHGRYWMMRRLELVLVYCALASSFCHATASTRTARRGDRGHGEKRTSRRLSDGSGGKGKGGTSSSSKSGKGKGKYYRCASEVAQHITEHVPEATAVNPGRCCKKDYPTAVFVTHGTPDMNSDSGFDAFWDTMYQNFDSAGEFLDVCFVMTGFDPELLGNTTLSDLLISVQNVTSSISLVPAIMTTDPTEDQNVMNNIREISESTEGPAIGVFNAGFSNIIIESLVSGKERLPYVGYADDRDYGVEASRASLELLGAESATALCFNGRPDLRFIGERCASFYDEISPVDEMPRSGIDCSESVNVTDVAMTIIRNQVSAVFAYSSCCTGAAQAVRIARLRSSHDIVFGCMDEDTTFDSYADFVTKQPVGLQAFHTFSFAAFPVLQLLASDSYHPQVDFPSLRTQVRTDVLTSMAKRREEQVEDEEGTYGS